MLTFITIMSYCVFFSAFSVLLLCIPADQWHEYEGAFTWLTGSCIASTIMKFLIDYLRG